MRQLLLFAAIAVSMSACGLAGEDDDDDCPGPQPGGLHFARCITEKPCNIGVASSENRVSLDGPLPPGLQLVNGRVFGRATEVSNVTLVATITDPADDAGCEAVFTVDLIIDVVDKICDDDGDCAVLGAWTRVGHCVADADCSRDPDGFCAPYLDGGLCVSSGACVDFGETFDVTAVDGTERTMCSNGPQRCVDRDCVNAD